ncbi:hypothetical protein GGI11_002305 [Coemansia sp. RSA 2049]|nr:hypothetical protein GGI11_002305 [Coemansia sp. RSA 2049]KAJ2523186.1 hypothetical protein H4217_000253 [Coemansia sp. RSA 1939]KAJ2617925.1 hypothetical protein EV177_000302 [Coemansia sp. RSA 1804]KAJ2694021.1 hypothetical protein GGH99_000870 [Coemansia sp. RSA 1285]
MLASGSSTFTLRYFDFPSRGEATKVLLLLGGAEWEHKVPAWPQEKSLQPVGRLPVLIEHSASDSDDTSFTLSETAAIEYYLATKYGYIHQPADPKCVARQLELRAHICDMYTAFAEWKLGPDEVAPKNKKIFNTTAGCVVRFHEQVLKENGSNGHYFGSTTTLVDISLFTNILALRTVFSGLDPDMLELLNSDNAPEMNKVIDTVSAEPALASYVAELTKL